MPNTCVLRRFWKISDRKIWAAMFLYNWSYKKKREECSGFCTNNKFRQFPLKEKLDRRQDAVQSVSWSTNSLWLWRHEFATKIHNVYEEIISVYMSESHLAKTTSYWTKFCQTKIFHRFLISTYTLQEKYEFYIRHDAWILVDKIFRLTKIFSSKSDFLRTFCPPKFCPRRYII